MSVKPIKLSESEREQLQMIIKKGSDWRERKRAQSLLMLSEGHSICCCRPTRGHAGSDSGTASPMVKKGLASLPGQPRCGAPSKLNEAHRTQLKEWIEGEPLTPGISQPLGSGCSPISQSRFPFSQLFLKPKGYSDSADIEVNCY